MFHRFRLCITKVKAKIVFHANWYSTRARALSLAWLPTPRSPPPQFFILTRSKVLFALVSLKMHRFQWNTRHFSPLCMEKTILLIDLLSGTIFHKCYRRLDLACLISGRRRCYYLITSQWRSGYCCAIPPEVEVWRKNLCVTAFNLHPLSFILQHAV